MLPTSCPPGTPRNFPYWPDSGKSTDTWNAALCGRIAFGCYLRQAASETTPNIYISGNTLYVCICIILGSVIYSNGL